MPIIPFILDQHVESAALLWLRRDSAVSQPHFTIKDLAVLDTQLDAHLDGLRIAEADSADAGWTVCRRELQWGEPGEVFPAALLALESRDSSRIQTVLDAVGESYELSRALVSALGWLPYGQAADHVKRFLAAEAPWLRRIGIAASTAHRREPGEALVAAVDDPDALLSARGLRAVGELGRVDLLPATRRGLAAEDEGCRFAAAWSVALIAGDAESLEALKAVVESNGARSERALQLVLRRLPTRRATEWIEKLAQERETARRSVIGAGVLGVPESVPWLIEQMRVPELARVAGEAFTAVAGVDLAYEDMEAEWPEGFVAGPTEDPEDEDVEMDPDENLPWPDPEVVRDWWRANQGRFDSGTRYLLGNPITIDCLQNVLRNGRQRYRTAAALELAIRQPGTPLFEVRAPGFRQQEMLS